MIACDQGTIAVRWAPERRGGGRGNMAGQEEVVDEGVVVG